MVIIECDCSPCFSMPLFLADLLDEQSVEQKMKELEESFSDLVDQAYKALLEREVNKDVHSFRSIFLSLNVSRKYLHQKFIQDNLKINEETTFDDLWMKLAFYWNFLNFDLSEHVINKFRIEDLKQKMKSYKDELQSFRKATRLCVFVNCWPLNGEMPPETKFREFVTKIKLDWENCTLEDIETKRRVFIRKFLLPEYALQLGEIEKGCIAITWLVPATFVNALQKDIKGTTSELFSEERIVSIIIDGQECYPTPTRKPVDYPQEHYTSQRMGKLQLLGKHPAHTELDTRSSKRKKISHTSEILPVGFEKIQPDTSEEEPHSMTLVEEILSGQSTSMIPSEKILVHGKQPQLEIEHQELCTSESGATKPRSGPMRSHIVEDQVQYFEKKFHSLKDKAYQEVSRDMKPSDFISRLTVPTQHQSFIEEKLSNISPPLTFENIWSILNWYWDFLNYEFLEHVIETFGSEVLKQQMRHYVDELSTFKQTTRLCDLCDFIESQLHKDDEPPEYTLNMVVKMQLKWYQCTLQDVESFKKALVDIFSLKAYDILFQKAEGEDVCITWLTSSSIATLLQQNLINIKTEFFKKQSIDAVTIDGQDVYLTPVKKYSGYLRDLYNSEQRPVGIGPPTPAKKLLPFKLARIEKEKVDIDEFTRRYLRGDMDDVGSLGNEYYKKTPMNFEEVGKLSSNDAMNLVLIEGAPGVGKTTFSWEFCRKWGKDEILQDHSLLLLLPLRDNNLKEAKTLSDLFYHPNSELQQAVVQEVTSNQGKGVAIWLEAWDELDHEPREKASVFLNLIHGRILPLATVFVTSRPWASEHLRENCGHRISQHVEVLTSAKDQIEYYISKAEAEAQPSSFAAKFTDYLSSNPVIRAAMYTPVTAKMAAEVFTWSLHTESPLPTTMTELFTAFTLKTLVDHLSTHPVYHKQQLKVTTFSDLPTDVYKQFQDLCRMAYEGILNRQQLVFSAAHLPTGFAPLGLMQEVPQLYTEGRASSYHFIHSTLQEYLSAVHISQLPAHEQTRLFQEHVNSGHFKMTMRFLAGHTKSANIPPDITRDTQLNYFHFLFEAKDISMTTRTLGSDKMVVRSHYSWTPLDYYVTGHVISHSNCPWRLDFYSSIDDEKFELFCQGCATPGETGCRGHISYADFSSNGLTSKSIQSFVNIPPHILQNMRVLDLIGNKLDGSACDLLAKAVPSMSRLEKLSLSGNPIGSGGAVEVINALCGSGVKQLLLWYTGIGEPDCEALCELLKSTHSLQHLDIQLNNLSSESVASIITGLSHNSSLTALNISTSHFSMANVDSLASVLKDHSKCTLTVLYLDDCHISSEGAVELAAALCKNTTLNDLDLIRNPIGEHVEGMTAVAKMLVENETLTKLYLEDCDISSEGAVELAAALCKNSTLKHLNLSRNPIGVEGASSMSDMLQHNTSLEELYLDDDSVGEEGVHQLINSLKHNQTLKKLWLPEKYESETSDHRIRWLW